MPGGQPLEDVRTERRRRGDGDPGHGYLRTTRGRSVASASRRALGRVRSRISTPSRWSSSCCADAGGIPLEVVGDVVARSRPRPRAGPRRARSTGTVTPCSERQPSSSVSVSSLAVDDLRVDDRDGLVVLALRRRTAAAARRPASRRARRRPRRPSALASARRDGRSSSSNSSTGFASIRSTGSGYWRIWASASRRRASRSASSSSFRTCPSISDHCGHTSDRGSARARSDHAPGREPRGDAARPARARGARGGSARTARSPGSRCGGACGTSGPTRRRS